MVCETLNSLATNRIRPEYCPDNSGGPLVYTPERRRAVSPEAAAAQQMMQLSTGYILSTALHAAVRLKIADLIGAAY